MSLKPCPFCGDSPKRMFAGGVGDMRGPYFIGCERCGYFFEGSQKDIRKHWNRRLSLLSGTLPDDPLDLVVRLREKLRPYAGLPDDFEQPIPGEEIREIANWLITEVDKEIKGRKR